MTQVKDLSADELALWADDAETAVTRVLMPKAIARRLVAMAQRAAPGEAERDSCLETIKTLLAAINPADQVAISMHEWNERLKAASAAGRAELAKCGAEAPPAYYASAVECAAPRRRLVSMAQRLDAAEAEVERLRAYGVNLAAECARARRWRRPPRAESATPPFSLDDAAPDGGNSGD